MRYPIISMRELDCWISSGRRMYLVDLRGRDAFERAHLKGAVNIPFDELEERLGELPAGIPLVFYCVRGSQSMLACNHLIDRGYQVVNAAGGLNAYRGPFLVSGAMGGAESLPEPMTALGMGDGQEAAGGGSYF